MILVTFDIDGTLTTPIEPEHGLFIKAVRMALGAEEIDSDWGLPVHMTDTGIASEAVRRSLGKTLTGTDIDRICQVYLEWMRPEIEAACRALPGALPLMRELGADDDVAVAIATGNWREVADRKLAEAGFDVNGIPVATSSDATARADIMRYTYDRALAQQGMTTFDDVVYLGDGIWDARASAELGWRFIGVATQMNPVALRGAGAQEVFEDYRDTVAVKQAILSR